MERIKALENQIKSLSDERLDLKREYNCLVKDKDIKEKLTVLEQHKQYLLNYINELAAEVKEQEDYLIEISLVENNNTLSRKVSDARIKELNTKINELLKQISDIDEIVVYLKSEQLKNKAKLDKIYGKRLTINTSEIDKQLGGE